MTTGGSPRAQINHALNAVRGVAALLVAVSHLRALFFVDYSQADSNSVAIRAIYLAASLGHPAVIVFFVLSGYWVGGSVLRSATSGTFSWLSYASARLSRLWLVLLPAILLTQGLDRVGLWMHPTSDIYMGSDAYHTVIPVDGPLSHLGILETLGNAFFVQSIHTSTLGSNSPLWSLAYEFWYYLIFPSLFLVFSTKYSLRFRVFSGAIFIFGCLIAGPDVLLLFPAWLVGVGIAWRSTNVVSWFDRRSKWLVRFLVPLMVSAVLGAGGLGVLWQLSPSMTALIVTLPAAALITILLPFGHSTKNHWLTLKLSDSAEWSYSLYALHMPMLALGASFLVPTASMRWQVTPLSIIYSALVFAVLLFAVRVFAKYTEEKTPMVRGLITKNLRRSEKAKEGMLQDKT